MARTTMFMVPKMFESLKFGLFITKTRLFKYTENFTIKKKQGGSNEYPQSMFLSRNKKNNVYPCKPQFYYMKVGFRGSILYRHVFVMIMKKNNNTESKVEKWAQMSMILYDIILCNKHQTKVKPVFLSLLDCV